MGGKNAIFSDILAKFTSIQLNNVEYSAHFKQNTAF